MWCSRTISQSLDEIILKRSDKYVALSNLSTNCTLKNIKKVIQKSSLTWNEDFEWPERSYSVLDIQDNFDS